MKSNTISSYKLTSKINKAAEKVIHNSLSGLKDKVFALRMEINSVNIKSFLALTGKRLTNIKAIHKTSISMLSNVFNSVKTLPLKIIKELKNNALFIRR